MSITFSSCFYIIPSKFSPKTYIQWMNHFISIVRHFYLVIYTDGESSKYIDTKHNPNIRVIIKPLESLHNYQYRDAWIRNHSRNELLNSASCWQLNMIWSEKIQFVKETVERKYFDTELYGWCDIGYFRNRNIDTPLSHLSNWCKDITRKINKNTIYYACIQNNTDYMNYLFELVNERNEKGLPANPIPPHQLSIAGGFFILHRDNIHWWATTYDNTLQTYFKHNYLVKDDQIILADCILSNIHKFTLCKETNPTLDNWFMFQRLLN